MSDVPSEVIREILLRLPAEPLFRFRSVCKSWRGIIDDPSFIKAHTNNQLFSHTHTLLVRNETGAPLYSFSLDSLNFINGPQKIHATPIKQLIRHGVPRLPDLHEVVLCNGLILISHSDVKKIWAIWNPLIRECHQLPQPNADLDLRGCGLGYDYDADDYKVVRIDRLFASGKVVYQTLVYSLKSDSWRMIGDCPCVLSLCSPGVFLNGTFYWKSRDVIIALDLGTESYCQLPICRVDLDALDGCLILSFNHHTMRLFDGWVMKDNGVVKSWMKLFSLELYTFHHVSWRLRLAAYLKSKRQVLLQND